MTLGDRHERHDAQEASDARHDAPDALQDAPDAPVRQEAPDDVRHEHAHEEEVPTGPFGLRLRPRRYEHRRPRRPSRLPRRLSPPPDREPPPDLSLFLYAGIVLAVIVVLLLVPYLIGYLVNLMSS